MKSSVSVFCLALTCASLPALAQDVLEFRSGDGLVRVASISGTGDAGPVSLSSLIESALIDSAATDDSLVSAEAGDDALVEIYFLDRSSGMELRFPAKRSQIVACMRRHPGKYATGTLDERVVRLVADMSVNLQVHMKTPGEGGGK